MKKFEITGNKGFHITFDNGLTASVQWGRGNFCENRFNDSLDFRGTFPAHSDDAEVAVIGEDEEFVPITEFAPADCYNDGDVCGWLTPEQVVDFLSKVKEHGGYAKHETD